MQQTPIGTSWHTTICCLIAAVLLVVFTGGCAAKYTAAPNPIEVDTSEYDRMYQSAIDVLGDRGFIVDRKDYRFGVITSRPKMAPTIFEPWGKGNATGYQALESTVNKQRRVVTVSIRPPSTPESDDISAIGNALSYLLSVEVMIEQEQSPRRYMTGSTAGYAVVSALSDTPTELKERGIHGAYWQAVGRDPYMEQDMIAAIVRGSLKVESTEPLPKVDTTTAPPTEELEVE